jgi:hypothetical protein
MVGGVRYSIWRDTSLGCYEVVRWPVEGDFSIVQTNILTQEKARKALMIWRQREKAHERAQPE